MGCPLIPHLSSSFLSFFLSSFLFQKNNNKMMMMMMMIVMMMMMNQKHTISRQRPLCFVCVCPILVLEMSQRKAAEKETRNSNHHTLQYLTPLGRTARGMSTKSRFHFTTTALPGAGSPWGSGLRTAHAAAFPLLPLDAAVVMPGAPNEGEALGE